MYYSLVSRVSCYFSLGYVLCAVCCVLSAACCVLRAVFWVLCAQCSVLCGPWLVSGWSVIGFRLVRGWVFRLVCDLVSG